MDIVILHSFGPPEEDLHEKIVRAAAWAGQQLGRHISCQAGFSTADLSALQPQLVIITGWLYGGPETLIAVREYSRALPVWVFSYMAEEYVTSDLDQDPHVVVVRKSKAGSEKLEKAIQTFFESKDSLEPAKIAAVIKQVFG